MEKGILFACVYMFFACMIAFVFSELKKPYKSELYQQNAKGFLKKNYTGVVKIVNLYFYGFIKFVVIIDKHGNKEFKIYVNNYFKRKYKKIVKWKR